MNKYCNAYLDRLDAAKKLSNPKESQVKISEIVKEIGLAAKNNNKEAVVAYCYLQIVGYKVEQNAIAGRERLTKMINKQRCPEAMFFVAIAFLCGDLGYNNDPSKSEHWFRDVALNLELEISDRKRATSALNVANLYLQGEVVTKDLAEAARFFELACSYGDEKSALMLGKIYLKGAEGIFGTIIPRDAVKGLDLLHKLASIGNIDATEEIVRYHLIEATKWCRESKSNTELLRVSRSVLDEVEWQIK
ncbi:hypothetical protein OTK49_26665 [Vibrio coralliirubri]|uniref:tetratricopeptide repeat protein n=1 Tax=Vibrio coralliirubri TaxID=1516159 RepID=UPI0022839B9E|nr:hypothetical protein [Vibrio coralliirubri]MCY9866124.1 hypothetical protein [Vibrio coralliirubri]